jgi:Immunity protein Imm1
MVTLGAGGESHLTVGGGSSNRYVVYLTFDNLHFLNLLSRDRADKMVTLFVGGQDGPFPDNTVVDLTLALRAAKAFAQTGQPDPSCKWSQLPSRRDAIRSGVTDPGSFPISSSIQGYRSLLLHTSCGPRPGRGDRQARGARGCARARTG